MLDILTDIINFRARAKGTTSTLVAALIANPKAHLFVGNERMKMQLRREYPQLQKRISTFTYSDVCGVEFDGPLLFDKEAVLNIAMAAHMQGKLDVKSEFVLKATELLKNL